MIKPGWGFSADYRPGQFVGIGLRVDGRWHWRFYSFGISEDLHTERFAIACTDKGDEGGVVAFAISDKKVEIDSATTLLEAGEKVGIHMPFGCRMGICQTCVLSLESGPIRDFRSGNEHGPGDRINTCVSAASGDCTLKI
ncbi:hypothetical protein MSAR_01470 [Mycolicibacterium sarraceniae]|uniref:2Fe-2S ferredoxin-type domain-containing protein n=1 Tax=Mycolicibacterium sarraceniae TaxID=1534348 RepID=A0A7I7SKT9_9MYCO|nr:hypothetical protein MSAR_01470 [Mycolicibacterium sarraceniae]